MITDTLRLNWLASHPNMRLKKHKGLWMCYQMPCSEITAYRSIREAIDAAMLLERN